MQCIVDKWKGLTPVVAAWHGPPWGIGASRVDRGECGFSKSDADSL